MHPFRYLRPESAAEAVAARGEDDETRYLAGGQSLLPALKLRLAHPSVLIDIARLPELRTLRRHQGGLEAGAALTHAEIAGLDDIPALAALAGSIGDLQIRNMGTLGGSLAHNDPASDHAAAVLGLGATVRTDRREIAADGFFLDMFETALEPDELIVSVNFPRPRRAGYAKVRNPASGYPVVGVFVAETDGGIRVAVTGAGGCVFRLPDFEAALADNFRPGALAGLATPVNGLNRDIHATAEYRAHLIGVLAGRAVERCR
ncbi:xanthine dehydrogenase family protein subunit M [Magnetospirillum sp. SS-4]|uniref:FAD binding domain-containing protein n=1 Tax=Magnetospirillum sp. SS-4 TaxID=2681465 RepID=UPI001381DC4A|nr:xanthine dehydrogenase family protein subunit M [Magnetospirillum sp. SS-4]CAA7625198.1 Aerobic-type carbon monoxide dehydrogenase [Magnetospirillum sp. SS-4]